MKRVLILLIVFTTTAVVGQNLKNGVYEGRFIMPPGNPAVFSMNSLRIIIDNDGMVIFTARIKFGPPSKKGDYVKISASLTGKMEGNSIILNGESNVEMLYFGRTGSKDVASVLNATLQPGSPPSVSGKFKVGNSVSDDTGLSPVFEFSAQYTGEEITEGLILLFPFGDSPKVIDKGWLFGARCLLGAGTDDERDLSENVEWSGTGQFDPVKGPKARAYFTAPGKNTIRLRVVDGENEIVKEFTIYAEPSAKYARIGSLVYCPADGHGGPACPLPVVGMVESGNQELLLDGMPVACVGDSGYHSACVGPNQFIIAEGDPDVKLFGKPVAILGSVTRHCGGAGRIVENGTTNRMLIISKSSSVKISNEESDFHKRALKEGTRIETGEKGMCVIQAGPGAFFTLAPGSIMVIEKNDDPPPKVKLEQGMLSYIGADIGGKDHIVIVTDRETIEPAGTRFTLEVSDTKTILAVAKGKVRIASGNQERIVSEGSAVASTIKGISTIRDFSFQAEIRKWQKIPEQSEKMTINIFSDTSATGNKYIKAGIIAGCIALGLIFLTILFIALKKRKRRKSQSPAIITQNEPTTAQIKTADVINRVTISSENPKFCPMCGSSLKPGAKFCGKCGTKL